MFFSPLVHKIVYSKNISIPIFGAISLVRITMESLYSSRVSFYCKVIVPQVLSRPYSYLLWFKKPWVISEINMDHKSIIFWGSAYDLYAFIPSSMKIDAFYCATFVLLVSRFLFWFSKNSKISKIWNSLY